MSRYRGDHRSQYDPGSSTRLRTMGCTPVSLANGIRVATGGRVDPSGDDVLDTVAITEESNPLTPGWSLTDAALAASRIAGPPPLDVRQGPWADIEAVWAAGFAVLLQGQSSVFTGGCSGTFKGAHCILTHPDTVDGKRWIGDPICPDWRLESDAVLQRYAETLFGTTIIYGVVDQMVPPDTDAQPGEPTVAAKGWTYKSSKLTGWLRGTPAGATYVDPADDSISPLPAGDYRVTGYVGYPRDEGPSAPAYYLVDAGNPILVVDGFAPGVWVPDKAPGDYNEGLDDAEAAVHNLPRR